MKRHSLKLKLTLIMAGLVVAVVGLLCILNTILFEKVYMKNRIEELKDSYSEVREVILDPDSTDYLIKDCIMQINALHNINVFVIDSNWCMAYSSQNNFNDAIRWFQEVLFNRNIKNDTIEENNDYTLLKGYDKVTSLTYLEIYGTLPDGSQIIMQITVESMKENIAIFNRFILSVGGIIVVVSIIIAYIISCKFTKPAKELSTIAEQMSELNFDAKYRGKDKDEIGLLGHSMNIMADRLEKNISDLKAANLELKKDIEIRNNTDKMRREFLSNVSHELKTPIALIQGYAEGLKDGITEDPESMEFYCDVIIDESAKMNNMVKKLLTLNQIEFGNDPVNIERFDLAELVSSIIKSNGILLSQNKITLDYYHPEPVFIWSDQIRMEEVFTNFLSNAINHCDGDKEIKVSVIKEDNIARLEVFNTGDKIPEADIEHIWEKFYKVDKARTREYGGNGIGLSIVKAILDNFNAEYGVVNKENGVMFWMEINIIDNNQVVE